MVRAVVKQKSVLDLHNGARSRPGDRRGLGSHSSADPVTLQSGWRQLYLPWASELKGPTALGVYQCRVLTAALPP